MENSAVLGLNQHGLEELVKGHVCTHVPVYCLLKHSRAKTSVVMWTPNSCIWGLRKSKMSLQHPVLKNQEVFKDWWGYIKTLQRHNKLLLATFFFQEWCERVNGKIIKPSLFLLPVTKWNIDLNRNINGSFETCWGIRHSHDLKVAPSPFLFANYSRERVPSQGRYMIDFMFPDDETQHH